MIEGRHANRFDVSVVIPSYNRADLLPGLMDALGRQTLPLDRFEVVVVDDGSTDDTPAVLTELAAATPLHLRIVRTPNAGAARARNTGWHAAGAAVVAFIDDDCRPEPGWLEAGLALLDVAPDVGVVQGRTVIPEGTVLGDWTITREVRLPTPWFESHNIFYRKAALDDTSGFDEDLGIYGEDTALGWDVLAHGWQRAFADDAQVVHNADERGLGWHIRYAFVAERNLIGVAARFPAFRHEGFWRPWAFQRHHVHYALAVAGIALAAWKRPLLLLVLPYLWIRRPPPGHHRYAALLGERVAVDTGAFLGRKVGAVRYRCLVI